MQMMCAKGFGPQRRSEPLEILLRQQRIVEHTCQVRHTGQRRQLRADPRQQFGELGLVTDVGREDVDSAVKTLRDGGNGPLRFGIRGAAAGQHDVAGTELSQMRRCVQTESTDTTGDQIGPIALRC